MESSNFQQRGVLVALSSPSGAGKTTLTRRLLEHSSNFMLSVSVTTRSPRPGEVEGRDYYFKSKEVFEKMKKSEDFLEWAKVFGNYYGTLQQPVMTALEEGRDVLFDIDWQGTQQLTQKMGEDMISVFILPPSMGELEQRLYRRSQDHESTILDRMSKAVSEISHWAEYDYVLVNEDLDKTLSQILAIIQAEKLKKSRQLGLETFVKGLMEFV
jgi:guanylate kinase